MGGAAPRFLFLLTAPFSLLRHRHHKLLLSPSFSRFHRLSSSPPSPLLLSPLKHQKQQQHCLHNQPLQSSSSLTHDSFSSPLSQAHHHHPWPEWSQFLAHISSAVSAKDYGGFVPPAELSRQFVQEAGACLEFARQRPNLLRLLSMRDVAAVVDHGAPFLFTDAEDSVRKMKSFVSNNDANVVDTRANLVDLMKFMLSYASNPLVYSEMNNLYNRDLVESSVRNLFCELFKLTYSAPGPNSSNSVQNQMPGRFGQTMPPGPKIEMKRGDWICPRCSFMNFARNVKCLECEDPRPKRQLAGGEWECPQCDFFNYGRNMTCLRCDCKKPGQISLGPTNTASNIGYRNGDNTTTSDVDNRLAANEEKAQRWFSKVSQLDNGADINSVIADEDFPDIMPLRKGVNRFVVSSRKTPLERRLANAQYKRNLGNSGTPGVENFEESINDILGSSAGVTQSENKSTAAEQNSDRDGLPSISSNYLHFKDMNESDSSTFHPDPLSQDMRARKSENLTTEESKRAALNADVGYASLGENSQLSDHSTGQNVINNKEKEQAEKSERWFRKVAELHNISDISDEDFPEIMPMRKGENRFVVSKKKDRSLTSPAYKRRMAMEQANSTNFVPFVPFPPDYFAKKDKPQTDGTDSTDRPNDVVSSSTSDVAEKQSPEMSDDVRARPGFPSVNSPQGTNAERSSEVPSNHPPGMLDNDSFEWERDNVPKIGNQGVSTKSWNPKPYEQNSSNNNNAGSSYGAATTTGNSSQRFNQENFRNNYSGNESKDQGPNLTRSSSPASESQGVRPQQWTGKSLEGSAVKEPDPLDMSEEAKAERWFRRVAQIKDISELSQIPDEDFPSIMPMRKGVNRFVVSKRKTPLERRLTSQQYRRNLPVVSSDPVKEENEGSR